MLRIVYSRYIIQSPEIVCTIFPKCIKHHICYSILYYKMIVLDFEKKLTEYGESMCKN